MSSGDYATPASICFFLPFLRDFNSKAAAMNSFRFAIIGDLAHKLAIQDSVKQIRCIEITTDRELRDYELFDLGITVTESGPVIAIPPLTPDHYYHYSRQNSTDNDDWKLVQGQAVSVKFFWSGEEGYNLTFHGNTSRFSANIGYVRIDTTGPTIPKFDGNKFPTTLIPIILPKDQVIVNLDLWKISMKDEGKIQAVKDALEVAAQYTRCTEIKQEIFWLGCKNPQLDSDTMNKYKNIAQMFFDECQHSLTPELYDDVISLGFPLVMPAHLSKWECSEVLHPRRCSVNCTRQFGPPPLTEKIWSPAELCESSLERLENIFAWHSEQMQKLLDRKTTTTSRAIKG